MVDPDMFPYKPIRARIGPQRFLIFDALHMMDKLSVEGIVSVTKLNIRRVKDQISSDLKIGMVSQAGNEFTLTTAGMDLLDRYKSYKRANNQPLPTPETYSQDDDRDDQETDHQPLDAKSQAAAEQEHTGISDALKGYTIADDDGQIRSQVF